MSRGLKFPPLCSTENLRTWGVKLADNILKASASKVWQEEQKEADTLFRCLETKGGTSQSTS